MPDGLCNLCFGMVICLYQSWHSGPTEVKDVFRRGKFAVIYSTVLESTSLTPSHSMYIYNLVETSENQENLHYALTELNV